MLRTQTVTIANGQTVSSVFAAEGYTMFGVQLPAAFTGTSLGFQVSGDGTTFQALYDAAGVVVALTVAASRCVALPSALAPWPAFKIVSNAAEGAARSLVVVGQS